MKNSTAILSLLLGLISVNAHAKNVVTLDKINCSVSVFDMNQDKRILDQKLETLSWNSSPKAEFALKQNALGITSEAIFFKEDSKICIYELNLAQRSGTEYATLAQLKVGHVFTQNVCLLPGQSINLSSRTDAQNGNKLMVSLNCRLEK